MPDTRRDQPSLPGIGSPEGMTLPRQVLHGDAAPGFAEGSEALVLRALALAWTPRHRKWLIDLLRRLELRTARGSYHGQLDIDECLAALADRGLAARSEQGWQCATDTRALIFRQALEAPDFLRWREAVLQTDGVSLERGWFHFASLAPAITAARLVFYGGEAIDRWRLLEQAGQSLPDWAAVVDQVALAGFDARAFARAEPHLAASMLAVAIDYGLRVLHPALPAVLAHALERLEAPTVRALEGLRLRAATALVLASRGAEARALLETRDDGQARAVRAAILATEGRWEEGAAAFEDALALRRQESGARKRLLDDTIAWLYPMCLFAGRDPARLATARRFCAGEGGPRRSHDDSIWSRWVRAADIRVGDEPPDPEFGELHAWFGTRPQLGWAQRLMLRAWLIGSEPPPPSPPPGTPAGRDPAVARAAARAALGRALEQTGLGWLAGQVRNAGGHGIAGLYAAGRTAVGVSSGLYVSGLSIADGVFSGRRVGLHAARGITWREEQ